MRGGVPAQLEAYGGAQTHARRCRCQFRLFVREVDPGPPPSPPPPAALPPLPAMARDYDHLFKLLIIGDSGEGSRPAPPRPLGTEGRGLRGAAGPEGGGGAGPGPAGCGGALGLCQPCGDRGPPQRRVVRLRDAAVSGPSTAGGG